MSILNPQSLAETLEQINEVQFFQNPVPDSEWLEITRWIAERHFTSTGKYANMFAPTGEDYRQNVRLFTGEKITSGAAKGHVLGEEACRALITIGVQTTPIETALTEASAGMLKALRESEASGQAMGMFCCGTCSLALWRHLAAGGLDLQEERLVSGLNALKLHRVSNGRYHRFPTWYAALAISEIDLPVATEEIRYLAPALERAIKKTTVPDQYARRKQALAERLLDRI